MMKKLNTKTIAMAGLLVALHIILSRFFSINAWNLKIGFAFVPIFVAAYLYGPLMAGVVGALGDFIGAILFPIGPYFPGFTLTCFLTGITFGLLLHKKQTPLRIAGAVAINQLVLGLLLNTYWICVLSGTNYLLTMGPRVVQSLILIPMEFLVMGAITRTLFARYKGVVA